MIDNIIALTIDKRYTRCWLFRGYNAARGVPYDKIMFWRGSTPLEFQNSADKIADMAKADGFPFIRFFQGHNNLKYIKQTLAQMCQLWSYAQILRYIKESGETCLVLWDDRFLACDWEMLNIIVSDMQENEKEFYLFQLRLRGGKKQIKEQQDLALDVQELFFQSFIKNKDFTISYKDAFTQLGMSGFDESIVFSPAGAEWLLDQMMQIEDVPPELKLLGIDQISKKLLPELMRLVNIDSYICYGLKDAIKYALSNEKGIYSPLVKGFNFIDEQIPMGSDTGYLTEHLSENEHFYAREEIKLDYLNRARTEKIDANSETTDTSDPSETEEDGDLLDV